MIDLEPVLARIQHVKSGFGPVKVEAHQIVRAHSTVEALAAARSLMESEAHQARMLATFILGMVAHEAPEAFALLLESVSRDPDWRVQEALAQAFDTYCSNISYEKAVPVIEQWLAHSNPNVRRAASEGLRIWTARPYFRENPHVAVSLLSSLRADPSDYVRRSAGNALRDISRKHSQLVAGELARWDLADARVAQTYKLASRFLG